MRVEGKAVKFGDNIDTDVIIPGKYLVYTEPEVLAQHAMEGVDPDFSKRAREGVVIVAGKNFGCGSSREQAPIALKHAGVRCVVAKSFARIFLRNAINVGLPVVEADILNEVDEGDVIAVDLSSGAVADLSKGFFKPIKPFPDFLLEILRDGGLVEHLKKRGFGK